MDLSDAFQTVIYLPEMCLPKWRASEGYILQGLHKIYIKNKVVDMVKDCFRISEVFVFHILLTKCKEIKD